LAESYPEALSRLISAFSRLPGIGPKTAQRLAFYLVKSPSLEVEELLSSLQEVKEKIHFCSVCGFYTEEDRCKICENPQRDRSVVCVVERPQDVLAIEKTGFRGYIMFCRVLFLLFLELVQKKSRLRNCWKE